MCHNHGWTAEGAFPETTTIQALPALGVVAHVLQNASVMASVSLNTRTSTTRRGEAGTSLIEMLVVIAVVGIVMAITVMVMPSALMYAKADSGAAQVVAALRLAREQAIAQRRNVRVVFTAPDQITVSRVEIPGPGTTVISDARIEGGSEFLLFAGVPDTPDAFGAAGAISFGGATTVAFTSAGEFVDQGGDPVNGTVYIGTRGTPLSGRAITIFGPTALIREWRWDGAHWTN